MKNLLWLSSLAALVCFGYSNSAFAASSLAINGTLTSGQQLTSSNGEYRLTLQSDGNLVLRNTSSTALWSTKTNGLGGVKLILQGDSNLVIYTSSGSPVWASNTVGTGANLLVLGTNGSLALYKDSTVVKTLYGAPAVTYAMAVNNGSGSGSSYTAGQVVPITANAAPSGQVFNTWVVNSGSPEIANINAASTTVTMPASNVTVTATYKTAPAGSNSLVTNGTLTPGQQLTSSNGQYHFALQSDGNLVLSNQSGTALWAAGTNGKGGTRLVLQGDGNLVLYTASGSAVWATGTNGKGATLLKLNDDGSLVLYAGSTSVWSVGGSIPTDNPLWTDASRNEWTFVTVPDIQHFSAGTATYSNLEDSFKWLVSNREKLNLKMVQGLGDMVERCDTSAHWSKARAAWDILFGANIPCSPTPGNHDSPNQNSTDWSVFNKYFPTSLLSGKPWWGGCYNGGTQAHYMLMTNGYDNYMFLTLSDVPDSSELNWAKGILNQYSNRKVIIATHNGQNKTVENSILTQAFKQIVLFNCGHDCNYRQWTVTPSNGGKIPCFQTDFQCDNPETALLRFYKFKPLEDKVEYYTYSPAKKVFDKRSSVSQGSFTLVQN